MPPNSKTNPSQRDTHYCVPCWGLTGSEDGNEPGGCLVPRNEGQRSTKRNPEQQLSAGFLCREGRTVTNVNEAAIANCGWRSWIMYHLDYNLGPRSNDDNINRQRVTTESGAGRVATILKATPPTTTALALNLSSVKGPPSLESTEPSDGSRQSLYNSSTQTTRFNLSLQALHNMPISRS
jgi:hypothetical protein